LNFFSALIELPWLLLLNLWNNFYTFRIWLDEIKHYYRYPPLIQADILWMLDYAWTTPFVLSRKATQKEKLPEDLTVYGETPWTSLEIICKEVNLNAKDVFVELGCGTGRNLLFVPLMFDCKAQGYELVQRFVDKLQWLLHANQLKQTVSVFCQNWFEADLSSGSVFFLVGTCYSDSHLETANQKLLETQSGSRIVTVSWPLPDPQFELISQKELDFSWGKGTVYFQRRV
jgi:SAM-dependent methyltransferase